MILYDRQNHKIEAGDVLKFDNEILYLVFSDNTNLIIQNLTQYTPSLILNNFAEHNIVPAVCIFNINNLD